MNKIYRWAVVGLAVVMSSAMAEEPKTVKLLNEGSWRRPWGFDKVTLVSAEKEIQQVGEHEHLWIKFVFEADLKSQGGGGEILGIDIVAANSAPDVGLNPSDFQLRVKSKPVTGITVTHGQKDTVRFETKEFIIDRKKGATEWPANINHPGFVKTRARYYSFDAGYVGNTFKLYKLDFKDIDKPTLEYLKTFEYAQGAVKDLDPKPEK